MDYKNVLSLIGGLSLFLFGMNIMGNSLEKRAGSKLSKMIGKLTTNKMAGFLTGAGVTAVIQSSSATTVMVVGFVNSGIMSLKQAINVIIGANVGTTITAWILSLSGIDSSNILIAMLKPSNLTPVLSLIGIIMILGGKSDKKKDTGTILLGFSTLMFGMDMMSGAVSGLSEIPEFRNILLIFSNPVFGVLAGAALTAIIQSSSASVGVLQALSSTGQVTIGTAIPIILGQNIGTCITAALSSIGANKNAKRTAFVHFSFNFIGCVFWLLAYSAADRLFDFTFTALPANVMNIAVIHSVFNIACTICLLPVSGLLEKLAVRFIPDRGASADRITMLDERLLSTPAFAIDNCRRECNDMAVIAVNSLIKSIDVLNSYDSDKAKEVREEEEKVDKYEDEIGSYLVRLSSKSMSDSDSHEATKLLHIIGDFERISDHAVNIIESAEEIGQKGFRFSNVAQSEIQVLFAAIREILERTYKAYINDAVELAMTIEPLEEVIDGLKDQIRARHILRVQAGDCSLEAGFILSDLLTGLERVADHCSNISGCVIEMQHDALDLHEYLGRVKTENEDFKKMYDEFRLKYTLSAP